MTFFFCSFSVHLFSFDENTRPFLDCLVVQPSLMPSTPKSPIHPKRAHTPGERGQPHDRGRFSLHLHPQLTFSRFRLFPIPFSVSFLSMSVNVSSPVRLGPDREPVLDPAVDPTDPKHRLRFSLMSWRSWVCWRCCSTKDIQTHPSTWLKSETACRCSATG